ncbi:MAG: ORF6N domain-containing protein [Bacteroidaceae bacterium]|nr:ORF6N domain-containing protein [Bacteroidaceae bacterium]
MKKLSYQDVKDKIVRINHQNVILDYAVAELYGVQTKEINQAVKNNPKKFPPGYIISLSEEDLRSKILTANSKSRVTPKAFTEKGLYMLATILKGDKAIETTISIIETYAKLRELSNSISEMSSNKGNSKSLMQKSGEIMTDLFGDDLETNETETEIELNFAVLKLKHKVKRKESNNK